MQPQRQIRAALAVALAIVLGCSPAHAIGIVTLNFNDGHDHVYLVGTAGASYDSNVFASNGGKGDYAFNTGLSAEYVRRAGWIGVNASIGVSGAHFLTLKDQDYSNPNVGVEFTKQSGRTTGSLSISATRSSRADSAVNLRSTSWNYSTVLNYAYPIIERFKMSGQFGYSANRYVDATNLVSLSTYTAAVNLFYVYNTERDLSAGYRYRYTETSVNDSTTDHNFTVGMSGRLIRGLNGSVNVGYQFRVPSARNQQTLSGISATGATTYALTRKLSLTGQISKDFSTTATDSSVDTLATDLDVKYAYNGHWGVSAGTGWGRSRFLGEAGRIILATSPFLVLGPQRQDDFFHWDAGISYSKNEHFKISLLYSSFKNWSTTPFADFDRSSLNFNVSSSL